jgi:hypothetical protein
VGGASKRSAPARTTCSSPGARRTILIGASYEPIGGSLRDDIADIAVAALTDDRPIGQLYELAGPRSLTFAETAAEIGEAAGREIRYTPVSLEEHAAEAAAHGVPPEFVALLTYLFDEVVDGRNADTTDGVQRALGREARDFGDYARRTAATASGTWCPPSTHRPDARPPFARPVRAGGVVDAARFGEVVAVGIPPHAIRELPPEPFAGKIVIDANDYRTPSKR